MADQAQSFGEFFPDVEPDKKLIARLQDRDIQSHEFQGSHNGLPLDSLKLFSCANEVADTLAAERRFIGKIGELSVDYTMHVTILEDSRIEVRIAFDKPATRGEPNLTYIYDLKNRLLVSTTPDIMHIEPETAQGSSAALTMVRLASGGSGPLLLSSRIHCILHVVIHVGGVCAWLFVGCGAPPACAAIIPAYILCAGPAVAAAIAAC